MTQWTIPGDLQALYKSASALQICCRQITEGIIDGVTRREFEEDLIVTGASYLGNEKATDYEECSVIKALIERIAALQQRVMELEADNQRLREPFTYGECEQAHELSRYAFKEAVDELMHCVDNANRYLNRRIAIEAARAAGKESV